MIDHDRKMRAGICLLKESWEEEIASLRIFATVIQKEEDHFLVDSSGCWIRLKSAKKIELSPTDKSCILGNFAGLSLETLDIKNSQKILSILGFKHSMGTAEQGWMSFTDAFDNTVSLMVPFSCPHLFFNPSLTFFNGKSNPQIIQEIRDLKIPITEEITAFNDKGLVDNIIIREPGGYGFFIFND